MFADLTTAGGMGVGAIRDVLAVDQVIIRDIHGNAIVVAFRSGDAVIVSKHKEPDFNALLARLGERPATVVNLKKG